MARKLDSTLAFAAGAWIMLAAQAALGHAGHDHGPASPPPPAPVAFDYPAPEPGTYHLPPLGPAADGAVLDSSGAALALAELLDGRFTVMSFIYTSCADLCPLATLALLDLHGELSLRPELAGMVQLVTLSFDPATDTPAVMAEQARLLHDGTGASWRFLTTASEDDLRPILGAYGQRVARKPDPDDAYGPLAHTLRVFLIDPARRIRNIYDADFLDPRLMLADLLTLRLEAAQARAAR